VPDIPWLTARDRIAEFVTLLAMVSATIARSGKRSISFSGPTSVRCTNPRTPGVVGSITMPHKINPEISEHLVTLSRLVRANASTALELHPQRTRSATAGHGNSEWCSATGGMPNSPVLH